MSGERGFSVVELMVALALSATLLLGLSQIFRANKMSYLQHGSFARVQESARLASEFMTRDVRSSDYWGCYAGGVNGPNWGNSLNPDPDFDGVNFGRGIEGQDNVNGVSIGGVAVLNGTDTLTVRSSEHLGTIRVEKHNLAAASIHVTANNDTLNEDQVYLITDCSNGDIFQNTAVQADENGTVVHNTGKSKEGPGNLTKILSKEYGPDARLLGVSVIDYFVAPSGSGSGNSLWRRVTVGAFGNASDGTPEEMVAGVVNLQILYGEDTDGNQTPDIFRTATAVTDFDAVVTVRMDITVASEGEGLFGQSMQRTYTANASLRNRLI